MGEGQKGPEETDGLGLVGSKSGEKEGHTPTSASEGWELRGESEWRREKGGLRGRSSAAAAAEGERAHRDAEPGKGSWWGVGLLCGAAT